jgi:mono/diheme cytochrome c family protein
LNKIVARYPARNLLVVLALLFLACDQGASETSPSAAVVGTESPDAGRRMYREGIGPSGEPLTAIVTGDVPLVGTQFSCQTCHGRSGMGSAEGQVVVPSIAGPILFADLHQPKRPAYDVATLARALRDGVGATGQPLDPLMPRYRLSDGEIAALAVYLASLPTGPSPGADDKEIRFATVVTDDVPPDVRDAVLEVLQTYVDEKNRQTRLESQRPNRGTTPASRLPTLFREWVLDVWTLSGPSEGWGAQLEERYRAAPVFAMLGGLSGRSWNPIGRFCEDHEIPCLFPATDLPDAEASDFYTLYFSRGLALEADLIARDLEANQIGSVIQVYCGDAPARAAGDLRSLLVPQGVAVEDLVFACDEPLPAADLASLMASDPAAAAVLWVRGGALAGLEQPLSAGRTYFSSTLLDRYLDGPVLSAPGPAFVAHPFRLPDQSDSAFGRFKAWARSRGIEIRYPQLQAEAFFACLTANDALTHLRRYLVRDYVLDMLDHAQGLAAYLPIHARPTLGPGQRFLTKGGYVLPIRDGQLDTKDATWILP